MTAKKTAEKKTAKATEPKNAFTRVYHPTADTWQDVASKDVESWVAAGWKKTRPAHVRVPADTPKPGEAGPRAQLTPTVIEDVSSSTTGTGRTGSGRAGGGSRASSGSSRAGGGSTASGAGSAGNTSTAGGASVGSNG